MIESSSQYPSNLGTVEEAVVLERGREGGREGGAEGGRWRGRV